MSTSSETTRHLEVKVVDDVAVVTFRRPERLNALNQATRLELAQQIRQHGTGHGVRGIVLTGEGRAFSAGEDLTEIDVKDQSGLMEAVEIFHDITRAILQTRVPVIAAVNGLAVGGASEVSMCCDTRIGSPQAEFYLPENGIGLAISNASSLLIRRLVGGHATRLVLASPRIKADEALRIGLLDELVPADELVDVAVSRVHEWTPAGGATAAHLALLRPSPDEIAAAIARENVAAAEVWDSGATAAGIDRFRVSKGRV
jgi:enoyl-CoA hydratase/carnithine racemase